MSMRVLMVGDDPRQLAIDAEVLKERKFRVYTCIDTDLVTDLVEEVKPEVVFINPAQPTEETNDLYHTLLDTVRFARLPVVYTLSEDDVYLVNKKRTSFKGSRNVMADNMIDAIKIGMTSVLPVRLQTPILTGKSIHLHGYASRA